MTWCASPAASWVCGRVGDRRRDDLDLLTSEQTALAGMRIEAAHVDLRPRDPEPPQRGIRRADDPIDALARDQAHRLGDTDMQGAMHDPRRAETQHQEHVVAVGPGFARDEARVRNYLAEQVVEASGKLPEAARGK